MCDDQAAFGLLITKSNSRHEMAYKICEILFGHENATDLIN